MLTYKQSMLIENYLANGGNGTQAAIAAGYSPKTAAKAAYTTLARTEAQERIAARLNEAAMSSNEVLAHLTAIARGCDPEQAIANRQARRIRQRVTQQPDGATITELDLELVDRLRALELLGKYHKLFTDKQELSADNQVEVRVVYVSDEH